MIQAWLMCTDDAVLQPFAQASAADRPDAVVVDWEQCGKAARQAHAVTAIGIDTTIRPDDADAVARVSALGMPRVVCRIDAVGPHTAAQVAAVRDQGGTDLLVPMWRDLAEIDHVRRLADGLRLGVMVETTDAVAQCGALAARGVAFAFVGLMDLALDRRTPSIFAPLSDGTMDLIAERLDGVPFGFGGLTLPDRGVPIPNRLLVGEMARLGASFSFMRRSFLGDVGDGDPVAALRSIRAGLLEAERRDRAAVERDRAGLQSCLDEVLRAV